MTSSQSCSALSSSSLSSFSPIRTLEQQYAPTNHKILLFCRTNANCCLQGGVETLLKLQSTSSSSSTSIASVASMSASSVVPAAAPNEASSLPQSSFNNMNNNDDDPFSFLQDSNNNTTTTATASTGIPPPLSTTTKKKTGMTSWAKSMAKKTTQNLERGMTGLAIRVADATSPTNRNPDVLTMVLLQQDKNLVSMTEGQALPTEHYERLQGCAFAIPLEVDTAATTRHVTLQLYIQSGATLLMAKPKYYLLGSIVLDVAHLQQAVLSKTAATMVVPLQSQIIVDGQVTIVLARNDKFPPLHGRGWSVTDPSNNGASNNNNNMTLASSSLYHLPLSQSYAYTIGKQRTFCATERAIESTVVLPIATLVAKLAANASITSLEHAKSVDQHLLLQQAQQVGASTATSTALNNKATVTLDIGYLYTNNNSNTMSTMTGRQATVSAYWQKPDCLFEVELAATTASSSSSSSSSSTWTRLPMSATHVMPFGSSSNVLFAPTLTPLANALATIRASFAAASSQPPPYLLGNVRLLIQVSNPKSSSSSSTSISNSADVFGSILPNDDDLLAGGGAGSAGQDEYWQAVIPLEAYIQQATSSNPVQIPVYSCTAPGTCVASIVVQVKVNLPSTGIGSTSTTTQQPQQPSPPPTVPSTGGLVSLVGLDTLMEDNGSLPVLDCDARGAGVVPPSNAQPNPALQRRQQQLQTMGPFVTHSYLRHHVSGIRSMDCKAIQERADRYGMALSYNPQSNEEQVPSYQDKTPKPFRPSSSRLTPLLSGIPFNVHVHSLSIEASDDIKEGALFHNVTCGAPSDHARGFSNIISSTNGTDGANVSPVGPVSGGLRRLEAKRLELHKSLLDAQSQLITAVGSHLAEKRMQQPNQPVHYIHPRHADTSAKRWKVFEATQALHHVTWTCAVRRANVFSQALGIAMTSYLTSVSDVHKAGWPDLWVRHGYLITYEGLLSAAGKELGMIEDASVGIAMLRTVSVVLVPDNGAVPNQPGGERVAIPGSPFLKWVQLTPSGVGSSTQYRLEVGMDPAYYMERVPAPLKNGAAVRLYPLLFQVGVDIRQWGANQEMKFKDQLSASGRLESTDIEQPGTISGGLLDDEDDYVGVTDDEFLISLNLEALRKMNSYAHSVSPMLPSASNGGVADSALASQVHPSLTILHQHIMSSAGRMNHSILDEAASLAQSFGGGGAVFCKSGKDRTAMHVTYKSAQFGRRYLSKHSKEGPSDQVDQKFVFDDASLMRIYGTRLPICEKNVGQAKYAFNALQVKFMPDMLKPPPNTLAGFLKGGRVFGGGGIES